MSKSRILVFSLATCTLFFALFMVPGSMSALPGQVAHAAPAAQTVLADDAQQAARARRTSSAIDVSPADRLSVRVVEITPDSHPWTTWNCARLPIGVRQLGRNIELMVNGDARLLIPAMSASGPRVVAPGDSGPEFWSKGGLANVRWPSTEMPGCAEGGAITLPFRASGNEPFWGVDYDGWRLALSQPGVQHHVDASIVQQSADITVVQGTDDEFPLRVRIRRGLCADTMSGLVRPYTVAVTFQDQELTGCGGDAARLLQGARWELVTLNGQALAGSPWLEFLPDGRLAGSNGCNLLNGRYTLTGEGVTIHDVATTRRACAPELMQQETRLNQRLADVRNFDFDDDGALRLSDGVNTLMAVEKPYVIP